MKTAVSLPDDVFQAAEALAGKLGVSRSRLFATAVAEFVAKHKTSRVTERLNAVYGSDRDLDVDLSAAQQRTLKRSSW